MTGAHDRLLDCDWCRELIDGDPARTAHRGRPVHPGDCAAHADEHEAVYARAAERLAAATHRDVDEARRDLVAVADAPPLRAHPAGTATLAPPATNRATRRAHDRHAGRRRTAGCPLCAWADKLAAELTR